MSIPVSFKERLSIPVIAAPMFLTSGSALVTECCKAGVVGTFPALNQRSSEGFEDWLLEIISELTRYEEETGNQPAPFGVNLIVHKTNTRLMDDLAICVKHKVPLIITSLGASKELIDAVHSYGGIVFHDIVNIRHAKKAAGAGVDGLIAVSAGAGGHAGVINPFALVNEIRQFFDKTVILAGCISQGHQIAAAEMMGADLAYMGTRFISTQESMVQDDYKEMITQSSAQDIIYTPAISGVNANFLRQTIESAGLDPDNLITPDSFNIGTELDEASDVKNHQTEHKAWRDIWSAGQGVGGITNKPTTAELVAQLKKEYQLAWSKN